MIRAVISIVLLILTSCKTHQPVNGTAIDEMNAALYQSIDSNKRVDATRAKRLPSRVSDALMPNINPRMYRGHYGRRFDIAVKNIPVRTFFMGLVKGTDYSMVVSPKVKGHITLNLKNVTVQEVLKTVEDVYGYTYRAGPSGYEILPNQLETKMYTVNYLELERQGRSNMQISSGQVSQSLNNNRQGGVGGNNVNNNFAGNNNNNNQVVSTIGDVVSKNRVDFWKQLKETLLNMVGDGKGRSVTVNALAGVVVVRAYPRELKQVEYYLDAIQNNMDRQVILEAKVLEVRLNDRYQMGIDWRIFGARLNALSNFPLANITQQTFPNAYRADFNWNIRRFTTTVQALSEQGNVQVLSSPRVTTMNNQKAVIKVGNDEFFVTNVSTATTTTANAVTPTQNVQLTPFFSGITLDVTPQIDTHGNVTLHIHPAVSRVIDQQKQINLGVNGILTLPLARSTIRESDTVVHAKTGQVVVIGGLMQNRTEEDLAGLPFFANVPFLGTLFKHTKQASTKSELVILLKPTVVKRRVWTKEAIKAQQQVSGLKRGFHIGGHPDVFGTEGEKPWRLGPPSGRYGRRGRS